MTTAEQQGSNSVGSGGGGDKISTRHRHLRSRDSMKREMDDNEEEGENSDDMTTASHYLNHRTGAKRKLDYITVQNTPKKRRRVVVDGEESHELQDVYCWECHKECVEGSLDCASCVRSFHPLCLPSSSQASKTPSDTWLCPVCTKVTAAECAETRTWAMQLLSSDHLSTLLSFALQRMKHSDSEPFQRPVPASLVPDYYDIIFNPMDLSSLEKRVKRGVYTSSDAFLEDSKWIVHNSFIFNGATSKYTNDAKLIIKICKHEISELELCPDCYRNSCVRQENWFAEPCTNPHCLVWAKLKGFPFWPAKALRMSSGNTNVDVRFFGAHDRAWIPVSQCFLLSEESPVPMKNMKKHGLDKAMEELDDHVRLLREKFGEFRYAPFKTEFKPEHLYNCPALFGGGGEEGPMRPRPRSPSTSSMAASSDLSGSQDLDRDDSASSSAGKSPARAKAEEKRPGEASGKNAGSRPAEAKAAGKDSMVNGVFTLNEELDKEVCSGSETLAQETVSSPSRVRAVARKSLSVVPESARNGSGGKTGGGAEEEEDMSCLERIKNSLQADLSANQKTGRAGSSAGESDAASEGEEPSKVPPPQQGPTRTASPGRAKISSTAPVASVRKRNLNLLLEKMHGSRHSPGAATGVPGATQAERPASREPQRPLAVAQHEGGANECEKMDVGGVTSSDQKDVKSGGGGMYSSMDTQDVNDVFQKHTSRINTLMNSAFADMWQEIRNSSGFTSDSTGPTPSTSSVSAAEQTWELKKMREEMTKIKWVHSTALAESKHSGKLALAELRHNMDAEKLRLVEEMKKKFEEEKNKAVADTKSKQWCASCGKEAVFYCCWNTSYCDYPCQQAHWPKHQSTCAQIRQPAPAQPSSSTSHQPQNHQNSTQNNGHHSINNSQHQVMTGNPIVAANHRNSPSQVVSSAQVVTSGDGSYFRQLPGGVQNVVPVYAAQGNIPPQGYILKSTGGPGLTLLQHRPPTGNGPPLRKF